MPAAAVVLSDLHLGAPHSVLNLKHWPVPEVGHCKHGVEARGILLDAVESTLNDRQFDRLILNGDTIDLSHGNLRDGIRELGTFLKDARTRFQIGEIVLLFGNHDRQWWDWQCQYDGVIKHLLRDDEDSAESLYSRITDPAGRTDAPVILEPLHEMVDADIRVAYPDFEFTAGGRLIRCHHGHLLEDLYSLAYSALLRVLGDFEDPGVRDRERGLGLAGGQAGRINECEAVFGRAVRQALDLPSANKRGSLEAMERLCAPLINLDWLLLGQTGLLQQRGDGPGLGRTVMEWIARDQPFAPEFRMIGGEHRQVSNPFRTLVMLTILGCLDFVARPGNGRSFPGDRHAYSGTTKNFVDAALDLLKSGSDELDRTDWSKDGALSSHRGKAIKRLIPAMKRHLTHFYSNAPAAYLVGHTHLSGQDQVPMGGGFVTVKNSGGWTAHQVQESDVPGHPVAPDGAFVVVNEDGTARPPVSVIDRLTQ